MPRSKQPEPAAEEAPTEAPEPDPADPASCWADAGTWAGLDRYECRLCAFDAVDLDAMAEHVARVHQAAPEPAPDEPEAAEPEGESLFALIERAVAAGITDASNMARAELEAATAEAEAEKAALLAELTGQAPDLGDQIAGAAAPNLSTLNAEELHELADAADVDHADLSDEEIVDALNALDPED